MTSPVGAHAPAGDPFFLRPPRLPGSSSRSLDGFPGCPVRPPAPTGVASPVARFLDPFRPGASAPVARCLDLERDAPAEFLRPVARPATPLRRPPVRPPRSPGSSSPAPHRLPREGSSARIKDHPPPTSLPPREPGWPFGSPPSPLRAPSVLRHRSSGPGWRALAGTEHTLHDLFPQVNRVFLSTQGYPPRWCVSHRSFSFIHRSHTGCAQVNV